MHRVLVAAGVLLMLGLATPAEAQCTVSANGVAFGSYDVFSSSPRDSVGTITFRCTVALTVRITLSTGSSGTFLPRTLLKGAESLQYNLFRDSSYTQIWGNGAQGTSVYQTTLVLSLVNKDIALTVYGRIPAGQDVSAGSYTDTVTVTINY